MNRPLFVIGGGGHCKVVVSTLVQCGLSVDGILDDDSSKIGSSILGIPVRKTTADFISRKAEARAILAIGDNRTRKAVFGRFSTSQIEWISVIHPRASVHPSAKIGAGTVIFAGAVIQPDAVIGDHCIINTGALIDHDCSFGKFCHIAPGCTITGGVKAEEGVFLGAGTTVIPYKNIGSWAISGAGSTIISDIPAEITVAGCPARQILR